MLSLDFKTRKEFSKNGIGFVFGIFGKSENRY